ncbi:DUF2513 domain-containing protein [Nitratireductor sp. GCM10026969]|uniref:DUF2513 domain-containing protein n=1 Tax=Nitratireductor sp. GCM10026969 TaxID=3252645 RepID=UPI0036155A41
MRATLLLSIEEQDQGKDDDIGVDAPGYEPAIVNGHLRLLKEAALSDAYEVPDETDIFHYVLTRLTWRGHEFLDTIRDPEIWRQTKGGVSKIGTASVELFGKLRKHTGNTQSTSAWGFISEHQMPTQPTPRNS